MDKIDSNGLETSSDGLDLEGTPTWRCFHCDEVFTNAESAREHFGSDEWQVAGCILKLNEGERLLLGTIRELQQANRDLLQRAQEAEMEHEMDAGLRAELKRYFGHTDAWSCWNVLDEMKGRALAADEIVQRLLDAAGAPAAEYLTERVDACVSALLARQRDGERKALLAERDAMHRIFAWLLGEEDDFPNPPEHLLNVISAGKRALETRDSMRLYWWRGELRQRLVNAIAIGPDNPNNVSASRPSTPVAAPEGPHTLRCTNCGDMVKEGLIQRGMTHRCDSFGVLETYGTYVVVFPAVDAANQPSLTPEAKKEIDAIRQHLVEHPRLHEVDGCRYCASRLNARRLLIREAPSADSTLSVSETEDTNDGQ